MESRKRNSYTKTEMQVDSDETDKTDDLPGIIIKNKDRIWLLNSQNNNEKAGTSASAMTLNNQPNFEEIEMPIQKHQQKQQQSLSNYKLCVKVYDRGVLVSDFNESSALYPLCRAWLYNCKRNYKSLKNTLYDLALPLHRQNNGLEILEQLQSGSLKYINAMPQLLSDNDEGDEVKVPTPEQLGYTQEFDLKTLDLAMTRDEEPDLDGATLLMDHKARWRKVKSNWIKQTRLNEKRFEVNFAILDTLIKSQMNIEAVVEEEGQNM